MLLYSSLRLEFELNNVAKCPLVIITFDWICSVGMMLNGGVRVCRMVAMRSQTKRLWNWLRASTYLAISWRVPYRTMCVVCPLGKCKSMLVFVSLS